MARRGRRRPRAGGDEVEGGGSGILEGPGRAFGPSPGIPLVAEGAPNRRRGPFVVLAVVVRNRCANTLAKDTGGPQEPGGHLGLTDRDRQANGRIEVVDDPRLIADLEEGR